MAWIPCYLQRYRPLAHDGVLHSRSCPNGGCQAVDGLWVARRHSIRSWHPVEFLVSATLIILPMLFGFLMPTPLATATPTPTNKSTPTRQTERQAQISRAVLGPSSAETPTASARPTPVATPTKRVQSTPTASITAPLPVAMTSTVTATGRGATACTKTSYTIRRGDTLTSIALRFGVSVTMIRIANPTLHGNILQIGKILLIPCPQTQGKGVALPAVVKATVTPQLLGYSTGGWPIEVFQFGSGPARLVFVGGIHGGYEQNTILLAYAAIDYFAIDPAAVPATITLSIIPAANPDGVGSLAGQRGQFIRTQIAKNPLPSRFNAHQVDLNRNWDCHWQPQGVWGNRPVNAGQAPFSEIETQLLRTFLTTPHADGVVFWHSAQPGVFAGGCNGRLATADKLAAVYAAASGYSAFPSFDSYPVTGDAADWLAQQGIPAIDIELTNHASIDWEKNLRAMLALIQYVAKRENRP